MLITKKVGMGMVGDKSEGSDHAAMDEDQMEMINDTIKAIIDLIECEEDFGVQ